MNVKFPRNFKNKIANSKQMEYCLEKIKTGIKTLKAKGVKGFIVALYEFCGRRIISSMVKRNPSKLIEKLKNFNSDNPEKVFNFSREFCFGFIRPWQRKEEFFEFLKILKEQKPKYILEIGTAMGGSLFCFCKLAPEDATIISIDLPEGPFGGGYPEWKIPLYQAFKKENQKLYLLRRDSHQKETLDEVLKILSGKQIDFLLIDGDHSYEGVKRDFEMYSPLVRKGGIIAFHDIVENPFLTETGCNVGRFWNEIKQKYNYKELVNNLNQEWGGIGIIFR